MPQINLPLLYAFKKWTNTHTNTHTHASSLALPHEILCISKRSTAPNLNCSLSDSINFLLPGIAWEWHI